MNPTVANIVDKARMAYPAMRTGDYRDLRRALTHLTAFPSVPFGIMARLPGRPMTRSWLCACTGMTSGGSSKASSLRSPSGTKRP